MDHPVVQLSDATLNLLSPSKFEPFVPISHQNLFRVLHLFDQMACGIQKRLGSLFREKAAKKAQEASLLKSLSVAPPLSKRTRTILPKQSQRSKPLPTKSPVDQNLVFALEKIRADSSFQRRTPGIYQPIISPAPDETPVIHIPRQFDGSP